MFDMVLNIPMGRKSHLLTLSSVAFSSSNAITPARENKLKKPVLNILKNKDFRVEVKYNYKYKFKLQNNQNRQKKSANY